MVTTNDRTSIPRQQCNINEILSEDSDYNNYLLRMFPGLSPKLIQRYYSILIKLCGHKNNNSIKLLQKIL